MDKVKKPHTQVEQERRDREKNFFEEFSYYLPIGRFDKLQTLNLITEIIKEKENERKLLETNGVIQNNEFNRLVLDAYEGFFMIINCRTGQIVYIAGNVNKMLQYEDYEWLNRNIFEFLHPNDVRILQSNLQSTETNRNSRYSCHSDIITTKMGKKLLSIRAQRGLICRLKHKNSFNDEIKYSSVHITGYTEISEQENHFLATVRLFNRIDNPGCELITDTIFSTHLDKNGRITFIDLKLLTLLGYTLEESKRNLLGKHLLYLCSNDDKSVIDIMLDYLSDNNSETITFQLNFKEKKSNETINFETKARNCLNGYNDQFEFIIAEHTLKGITKSQLDTLPSLYGDDDDNEPNLFHF